MPIERVTLLFHQEEGLYDTADYVKQKKKFMTETILMWHGRSIPYPIVITILHSTIEMRWNSTGLTVLHVKDFTELINSSSEFRNSAVLLTW